jgi:hypothetical protein
MESVTYIVLECIPVYDDDDDYYDADNILYASPRDLFFFWIPFWCALGTEPYVAP